MQIIVLGAGAGGGFPQWNCDCPNCRRVRAGDPSVRPLTQSSVAVSADGQRWVLLNASPDLRRQIEQTPRLHPSGGGRNSPIRAVATTNADVDHTAGLLTLREAQPLAVYGTRRVLGVLEANAMFNVLDRTLVSRKPLVLDEDTPLTEQDGTPLGLSLQAFAVPGKVALWLEQPDLPAFGSVAEDTVGFRITDTATGAYAFYIPGCASLPPDLAARLDGAPLLLFDGTTYSDDEMIQAGLGTKTATRMGHMSLAGAEGSLASMAGLTIGRRIYVHINNTNPLLLSDSIERRIVESAGWEVGHDGMEIRL